MAIQKTLLIGNGLNRTFKPAVKPSKAFSPTSWNDVLKRLADYSNLHIKDIQNKPLTLVFDEILLKTSSTSSSPLELQKLLQHAVGLSCNDALDSVFYSITKNVLTTNYSTRHAVNFDDDYLPLAQNEGISESNFSLFRYFSTPNDRRLWYINGNTNTPSSLTLGYRQYARYQGQIKNYLFNGLEYSKRKVANCPLFRSTPNFEFDKGGDLYSWVDIFLRDQIEVVGLSMDYTESILWWLLTEKMYLNRKHPKRIGGLTYHHVSIDGKPPKGAEANKLEMLNDLGVKIKTIEADTFLNGYLEIAEGLKKGAKTRYQKRLVTK